MHAILAAAALLLMLAGCSHREDVSGDVRFQSVIGKELAVTRVCYAEPPASDSPFSGRYLLIDEKAHGVKSTVINMFGGEKDRDASGDIRLPKGYRVQIDSVQSIWGVDSGTLTYALGHFVSPGDSRIVNFYLFYSGPGDTNPAPWE